MEMTTANKKKKRRTRKCLDEIRKRSRRTMRTDYFGQTSQQRVLLNRAKERQTPRLITMNRLTLNMFPKAIRSETITRPILEEIKQKSNLNYNEDLDKNIKINCIDLSKVENFEHCNSAISDNIMFDLEEVSLHEHVSKHSVNLLRNNPSPICVSRTQTPTELLARIQVYSTSQSSQTSEGDHIHELYEELMNKISSHLKTVTSTIIKEDVIKIATVNLQKLYNKSWNKGYKTTMVDDEKNNKSTESPKDTITQNPLEYIRYKHVQQQDLYDCHVGLSDVFSLALSPEAAVSTETPQSSLTFTNEGIPDVTLYDTPEYNYYPHRLN